MSNVKIKRFFSIILLVSYCVFTCTPGVIGAVEFSMSADLLLQSGVNFYDQGRFQEAMQQFQKVLIVDPHSSVARDFLGQIQKEVYGEQKKVELPPAVRSLFIREALDAVEQDVAQSNKSSFVIPSAKPVSVAGRDLVQRDTPRISPSSPPEAQFEFERTIILDDRDKKDEDVLQVSRDGMILIRGNQIVRFLNSTPENITLERYANDSIVLRGIKTGSGIVHVWDARGRWTFNVDIGQTKLYKAIKDAYDRRSRDKVLSSPFVVTYSWDRGSFHTGRRFDETERTSLSINQSVSVRGETPYGLYDASFAIYRLNNKYDIFNLRTGLTDAHFWGLEHLNIRLLDFSTGIGSFKFPNADLRGVRVDAPMFNKKLRYTAFWGGIPEGTFARLQPGLLDKTVDAYLFGLDLYYDYSSNAQYKLYFTHSYGSEINRPVLTNTAIGGGAFYRIGKLNLDSEAAYDTQGHMSYTSAARLNLGKNNFSVRLTENDSDFASPLGGQPAGGSTTVNLTHGYSINDDAYLTTSLSAQRERDKDLVNPDNPDRPNYTFDSGFYWRLDPFTSLRLNYLRDDSKGSIAPGLRESEIVSINRKIFFLTDINTFLSFTNGRNKNYSGSSANYNRQSVRAGFSFQLINNLVFSMSETNNFIQNRVSGEESSPHALETGLHYYSRILKSPFYARGRVFYRDEEETESDISFLSGEDRLEFQLGLDYRPSPDLSAFLSMRAANIWAEQQGNPKRFEADIRYGVTIAWDTGFRWNTKGNAQGFVFYDEDADGIRDKAEKGVEGVRLVSSNGVSDSTNAKGHYLIKGIVGKKAVISIDRNSIPRGYLLTTDPLYEFEIAHLGTKRFDFGITTRTDIVGTVFIDYNANNRFDRGDEPIGGALIILDDGSQQSLSNEGGQFHFRRLEAGQHIVAIDLQSIPTEYIPKIPLKTTIQLEEGETLFFNIPLRESFKGID